MTLTDLHKAIKPQFVWAEHNSKDLQTDAVFYKGDGSASLASVVFIGISFMNGFKAREVSEYLNIIDDTKGAGKQLEQYHYRLGLFKKAIIAVKNGTADKQDKAIHLKTSLTLNYLRNHSRIPFVALTDFKY